MNERNPSTYFEKLEAEALRLAMKQHPNRDPKSFKVANTYFPFLQGTAVLVHSERPKRKETGKDLYYFPGRSSPFDTSGGPSSGGMPSELIRDMEDLANLIQNWSRDAARSEVAALRQNLEESVTPGSAPAVEELKKAEGDLVKGDSEGFIQHIERFVSIAKDIAELGEKLHPAASAFIPAAASVLAPLIMTFLR